MQTIPIHLAPPDRDIVPHSYVIHLHSQLCRCGSLHEHSELYAKTHLRRTDGDHWGRKYVTNLRPIHKPEEVQYNLPIETIKLDVKRIPFCHECYGPATLTHLPPPPAQDTRKPHETLSTSTLLRNSPLHQDLEPKKTKPSKKQTFTLDDI